METLDAGSRQSVGLPSMNYLDSDKIKREEAVDYQRKHLAATMVSPSYSFHCPPPPFNSHQSTNANSVSGALSGLISPPESRRTSGDEKEQRLPSIHEALGPDQPYPVPPSSGPVSTSQHYQPPAATPSPSDQGRRTYSADLHSQGPPNPYSHPRSPYMNNQTSSASGPPLHAHAEPLPRPPFSSTSHNSKLPTLHPLRTTQSPPNSVRPSAPYPYPQQPTSTYEPAPQSAGSMNPPYVYSPYPSQYPYSAPPQGVSGPAYPPSATYSTPGRYQPAPWRSDGSEANRVEENKKAGRLVGAPYGESVKRHLDNFDLEASLNEIAEGSGRLLDFAGHYKQRAHESQRTGMTPASIPNLEKVDELMKQEMRVAESLARIREVIVNQQAALVEQAQDPRYKAMNGYDHEGPNSYHDDGKGGGGFAGSDPKKRRGRAAPPGRCHSCNRAETPEWRRGPDGARTLCNACGLHYAKLTRKMGGNKAAIGSSNLRPKSMGPGSPAA